MTSSTRMSDIREELDRLYNYDGPAHPDWASLAVRASLHTLHFAIMMSKDVGEHDEDYKLVHWVFKEGLFPELSKLLNVTPTGFEWREGVSKELRKEMAAIARSQFKILHARPGAQYQKRA